MNQFNYHYSVMLNETIENIPIVEEGIYVDCTLGMGGHSKLILEKISKNSKLICFDKDLFAINNFKIYLQDNKIENVILVHDDFKNLKSRIKELNIKNVNAFIFDLGVSSPQLDNAERGFSYHTDGPLDMRMDSTQLISAKNIINEYPFEKLFEIFKNFSESKFSYQVAKKIIKEREIKEITSTLQLVEIIKSSLPNKELNKKKHPAKVFFQAIRIEVNQELSNLDKSILDASDLLTLTGVISIITFHSLEDKIIKNTFKKLTESKIPSYLPIKESDINFKLLSKASKPSIKELDENRRSKSAKLRIIRKDK